MAKMTMTAALNRAIDECMAADEGVILLGEDVSAKQGGGVFKVSAGLTEKYGEDRVRATPISEQAIMGACVGAALAGMRPIAEIMLMNFTTIAMDQIVNHAAKLRFMSGGQTNVPLVVRTTTGVGVGFGGQHSDMLEAWFVHVPGLKVVTPSNPPDGYGLMKAAIACNDPVIFIENILSYGMQGEVPDDTEVPLGQARVARQGDDVTIISYGRIVNDALAVAEEMTGDVSVEVIDLRTIAPFDEDAIVASVRKTGRAVVLHEAVKVFGTGAEIAARLNEQLFGQLKAPVERLGGKFSAVPMASALEQAWMPSKADIAAAVRRTMEQRK